MLVVAANWTLDFVSFFLSFLHLLSLTCFVVHCFYNTLISYLPVSDLVW